MATFEELLRLRELELKEEEKEFNPFDPGTFGWCGVASGIGGEPGVVGSGMDDVSVRGGLIEDTGNAEDGIDSGDNGTITEVVETSHKHSYLSLTDTDDTFDGFDSYFPKVEGSSLRFSKIKDGDIPSLLTKKTYRSNKKEAFTLKPYGSATGETGELRFLELSANGSNCVAFKAPDSLAANTVYVLPTTFPATSGYALVSTTAGVCSWAVTGAGATTFVALTDTFSSFTAKKIPVTNEAGNAIALASNLEWDETNDRLEITSASAFGLRSIRTTATTNLFGGVAKLTLICSGNMEDGFGPALTFAIDDNAVAETVIANIGAVRSGADNTGTLIFKTDSAGSSSERVRVNEEGLLVGGASDVTCGGTGCIVLQNLNAPNASPNNAPVLFSDPITSGSGIYCLNIRNSDGTVLKLQQKSHIADATSACPDIGTVLTVIAGMLDIFEANGLMATA